MLRRQDGTVMAETAGMAAAFAIVALFTLTSLSDTRGAVQNIETFRAPAVPVAQSN